MLEYEHRTAALSEGNKGAFVKVRVGDTEIDLGLLNEADRKELASDLAYFITELLA